MKKHLLSIFLVISFFLFIPVAQAALGDLRYEITKLDISPSNGVITFEGWAFLHKTHNFMGTGVGKNKNIKVYDTNSNQITDGGQKVQIQAYNNTTKKVIETKTATRSDSRYNFYCQMFYRGGSWQCSDSSYQKTKTNESTGNKCTTGSGNNGLQECYYEDLDFKVTFDTNNWQVNDGDNIIFKIIVTNTDYQRKKGTGATVTEELHITSSTVKNYGKEEDKIQVVGESVSTAVEFIAQSAMLRKPTNLSANLVDGHSYRGCNDSPKGIYKISDKKIGSFVNGYQKSVSNQTYYNYFFLAGTLTPGMYLIEYNDTKEYYDGIDYCLPGTVKTGYAASGNAAAWGSWVKPTGDLSFTIKINKGKKCTPEIPSKGDLTCNNSKDFNSTCKELTVRTGKGSATVKIEQTGTISSILTPEKTYAGGGFNFGILYYNKIKWSYVSSIPGNELHSAVVEEMNKKLKDYNTYTSGLNITQLKLGNNIMADSFLVKKCTTSNKNKDYYNKDLTVSCVFYFPKSTILQDGSVKYTAGNDAGITSKYYTPIDHSGKYNIEARIVGMDRITAASSTEDSEKKGTSWTGIWEDNFKDCMLNLYPLLYKNGKYNFIYRPIDINNPFPNRNAGINWFDWYAISENVERLESAYDRLQYSVTLDNQTITQIKKYNKQQNSNGGYFDWNTMNNDKSSFVDDYFEIKRQNIVGDNS